MTKQRGYSGSESHFRRIIAGIRPRPAPELFARLDMPPAEQAQVDWAHFGTIVVGRAHRAQHATSRFYTDVAATLGCATKRGRSSRERSSFWQGELGRI